MFERNLENLDIRPFRLSDQDKVFEFCKGIFEEFGWPLVYAVGIESISEYFDLPNGIFVVVDDKGRIVGTGGIKVLEKNVGLLKRFYVEPALRGKGVAAQLMDQILIEAKQRPLQRLVLDHEINDPRAHRFYQKCGFIEFHPGVVEGWQESEEPDEYKYMYLDL